MAKVDAKKVKTTCAVNKETEAMVICSKALNDICKDGQHRVLTYLRSRYFGDYY